MLELITYFFYLVGVAVITLVILTFFAGVGMAWFKWILCPVFNWILKE